MTRHHVHILIVEDNEEQAQAFDSACKSAGVDPQPIVEIAPHKESALEFLEKQEFDFIVCDLAIPLDGSLRTPNRRNGMSVLEAALEERGTPIIICSEEEEDVGRLLELGSQADPFGQGLDQAMLTFHNKEEIPECQRQIREYVRSATRVASIELEGTSLRVGEARAVQVYAQRSEGAIVQLATMNGHSAEKTLRVDVADRDGYVGRSVVAKIGDRARIRREASKFRTIAKRLPPELIVSQADVVDAGAGRKGGVFYGFADRFDNNLFACLSHGEDNACRAVEALRQGFLPLNENARLEEKRFAMIRRELVGGDRILNAGSVESGVRELDDLSVEVATCLQHGDLHGENVLVDGDGRPVLIDYARTADSPASLDPVTLELSAVLHPGGQEARGNWPSLEQMEAWNDLDNYLVDCPFPEFVRAVRGWTSEVARSQEETEAVVLAYCLRQLRYEVAIRPLALRLAEATVGRLRASDRTDETTIAADS